MTESLSVADKLLMAASTLDRIGPTFTAEDLVVAAWEAFPDTFGLRGHLTDSGAPKYPDSNRVFAEIMGSKPIRARGLIEKVGSKRYRLTSTGKQRAFEIQGGSSTRRLALDRGSIAEIRRLLSSRAMLKFRGGEGNAISFHDAASFWGITARSSANELRTRFADIDTLLSTLTDETRVAELALDHSGRPIGAPDIAQLRGLHDYLKSKFEAETSHILRRKDER